MKICNSTLVRHFLKVVKERKGHSPLGFYKSKNAEEYVDGRMMSSTIKQFADQAQLLQIVLIIRSLFLCRAAASWFFNSIKRYYKQ